MFSWNGADNIYVPGGTSRGYVVIKADFPRSGHIGLAELAIDATSVCEYRLAWGIQGVHSCEF